MNWVFPAYAVFDGHLCELSGNGKGTGGDEVDPYRAEARAGEGDRNHDAPSESRKLGVYVDQSVICERLRAADI
jgi:hypothetical protein